jgi:hypothetical protein
MTDEVNDKNDGVWSPFGEQRWRELAEGTGASELQLRFAAARFSGASATKAAGLAGYADDGKGSLRRAGYSAVRSTCVQNLLELAAINAPADAKISDKEIDAKISRLIRSGDPNVVLKAAALHQQREAMRREIAASAEPQLSPAEDMKELLACPLGGLLAVSATYLGIAVKYGPRVNLGAFPLFKELAPHIKAEWPDVWARILSKFDSDTRNAAEIDGAGTPSDLKALTGKRESENAA